MPVARFEMADGRIGRFEVPEGTTPEQAQAMIASQQTAPAAEPNFGARLDASIKDIPRQVGLTARYGIEGGLGALGTLSDPIAGLMNMAGAKIPSAQQTGSWLSDKLGLPSPQSAQERAVGDATRMVAGTGLMMGGASQAAKSATGVAKNVLDGIAQRPGYQLASAAGGGLAGGYTKESGGGPAAQFVASLAGGVGVPMAMEIGKKIENSLAMFGRTIFKPEELSAKVDLTIENALKDSGLKLSDLPNETRNQLRQDVTQALKTGDVNPDALKRAADYRLVGATPMRGNLTLNPVDITRERNLAKVGANSTDPALNQLANIQNTNNRTLIEGLNKAGANTADDSYSAGQKIIGALESRNAEAKSGIDALYGQARDTQGRSATLDPHAFTNRAGDLLHEANVESFLTPDIRNKLNSFASGNTPLNVEIAEQFKTSLGQIQRASSDGNVRTALGLVRQALDETPLIGSAKSTPGNLPALPGIGASMGQQSIDAFNQARRANRDWMGVVEKTPALQAVRDGVEPDKFVNQYIIGNGTNANVMDVFQLKNLVGKNPEAMGAIRGQITSYLKQKALNNASDEVGNFSQSAYNNAIKSIGDRKLSAFFDEKEIAQLKAIGRVASYEQIQPKGSAVNNSNTAGAALGMLLDKMANSKVLGKIPFAASGIGSVSANINARRAADVPKSLLTQPQAFQFQAPIAPMLMLPGLLGSP